MSMRPVHMCQAVLVVLEVGCCGACMTWMSFSISMIWIFFVHNIMHLSMLSCWGGRPGKGGGFEL